LNQIQLAANAGCHNTTVSRIELGKFEPRPMLAIALAKAVGVDLDTLYTDAPDPVETVDESEDALLRMFRELSPDARRDLMNYVSGMHHAERRMRSVTAPGGPSALDVERMGAALEAADPGGHRRRDAARQAEEDQHQGVG